ncbi:MAG: hypothetical protein K2X03_06175 [Bryobacteraceae bacterium]|nr:hypothetical protein [Bryobacteraceae bacterium]
MSNSCQGFVCLVLLLATVLSGQTTGLNETVETVDCLNGATGELLMSEFLTGVSATATFVKVSDCSSKLTFTTIRPGLCTARPRTNVAAEVVGTPSPKTPIVSFLDAGPAIIVRGPGREVRIPRVVNGPATTYSLSELRQFTSGVTPLPGAELVRSGRFTVSAEGGRDIAAFQGEWDFVPLQMTRPVSGSQASVQTPPAIEWSGGDSVPGPMDVRLAITTRDGRQAFDIICRLPDGRAGSFTVPTETWSQIPAAFLTGSVATVSLLASAPLVNLSVPELDKGLRVGIVQSTGAVIALSPPPTFP